MSLLNIVSSRAKSGGKVVVDEFIPFEWDLYVDQVSANYHMRVCDANLCFIDLYAEANSGMVCNVRVITFGIRPELLRHPPESQGDIKIVNEIPVIDFSQWEPSLGARIQDMNPQRAEQEMLKSVNGLLEKSQPSDDLSEPFHNRRIQSELEIPLAFYRTMDGCLVTFGDERQPDTVFSMGRFGVHSSNNVICGLLFSNLTDVEIRKLSRLFR